jgi:hypothetical protein
MKEKLAVRVEDIVSKTGPVSEVTGSLVHWSNRWLSWFNNDKKPLNLINT